MKLAFIYVSGFVLLLYHTNNNFASYGAKEDGKPRVIGASRLQKAYRDKRMAALANSYVLGYKKGLSRKHRRAHKNINLLHLFTPSGLHFSTIAFIVLLLARVARRLHPWASLVLTIPLHAAPFFFSGHYAIKRIVEYRVTKILLNKMKIDMCPFWIFVLVFSGDFLFGTYRHSPLSFSFSYIFLGIIFCMLEKEKMFWPYALLGGQIIVSFCLQTSLTYLGFYFGFVLTGVFTLIFPFLVLNYLLPYGNFSEYILRGFVYLVELGSEVSSASGFFYPEFNLILIAVMLACGLRSGVYARILLVVLLITTSFPTYNVPGYAFRAAERYGTISFLETSAVRRMIKRGTLQFP